MNYYLKFQGNTRGPYILDALHRFMADGMLSGDHLVSIDQTNWLPITRLAELRNPGTISVPTFTGSHPPPTTGKTSSGWARGCGFTLILLGIGAWCIASATDRPIKYTFILAIVYGIYSAVTGKWFS